MTRKQVSLESPPLSNRDFQETNEWYHQYQQRKLERDNNEANRKRDDGLQAELDAKKAEQELNDPLIKERRKILSKISCAMSVEDVHRKLGTPERTYRCSDNKYEAHNYGHYWVILKFGRAWGVQIHKEFDGSCLDEFKNNTGWWICNDE